MNLLKDGSNHYVEWRAAKYGTDGTDGTDPAYGALINASGVDIAKLVEGAKIVAPVTQKLRFWIIMETPLIWQRLQTISRVLFIRYRSLYLRHLTLVD